jgi:hypothetical protein
MKKNAFEEYDKASDNNMLQPPAMQDPEGSPTGYCYDEKIRNPQPPPNLPPQTEPDTDPTRTNWPLFLSVMILICLAILIFNTSGSRPTIDFSAVEKKLEEIHNSVRSIAAPKTILPISPDVEKLRARIIQKDIRIKQLEKDVSWLKHLLEKERNKPRVNSSKKYEIERHYKMREYAISELFRAPWREGEGTRTLCFTTGFDEPQCHYRTPDGQTKQAIFP